MNSFLFRQGKGFTRRARIRRTLLYVQGVHMLVRRRILHPRPDPWTQKQANRFCHVYVLTCTPMARFEDRYRNGKDEIHGRAGSVTSMPEERHDWSLITARRPPCWLRPMASHWCRGDHVRPDAGTSASFSPGGFCGGLSDRPGLCVLFRNVGICNRYSQRESLTQQLKRALGKEMFSHRGADRPAWHVGDYLKR